MFDNILRGPVVEFPTQHSTLRYASDGMLGQCEDLRIFSYEWYRSLYMLYVTTPRTKNVLLIFKSVAALQY